MNRLLALSASCVIPVAGPHEPSFDHGGELQRLIDEDGLGWRDQQPDDLRQGDCLIYRRRLSSSPARCRWPRGRFGSRRRRRLNGRRHPVALATVLRRPAHARTVGARFETSTCEASSIINRRGRPINLEARSPPWGCCCMAGTSSSERAPEKWRPLAVSAFKHRSPQKKSIKTSTSRSMIDLKKH